MTLEQLRIRLNIFRVQTRQKNIPESNIDCFIVIDGKRYPVNAIHFEKAGSNKLNVIFK